MFSSKSNFPQSPENIEKYSSETMAIDQICDKMYLKAASRKPSIKILPKISDISKKGALMVTFPDQEK